MFIFNKYQRKMDLRFPIVDQKHPTIKKLKYWGRRAANAELNGNNDKLKYARNKLDEIINQVDMSDLNILSYIVMIVPPTSHAMATGRGGIWAMVTRHINESASRVAKNRPMFELV